MTKKILVVALAGLTAVAVAQSDGSKEKPKSSKPVTEQSGDPHEAVAPRDAATGQASGKRMHKPITVTAEVGIEAPTASKEVSKKEAADDWQTPAAKSTDPHRVAPTMMSDGKTAAPASNDAPKPTLKNTAASSSDVKSPRDAASGQASGRERPRGIGSSGQDGVSTAREASSGMATGRRSAAQKPAGSSAPQTQPEKK